MQHRVFLAPLKPGVAHADAHGHWITNHRRIMQELEGVRGYVQNQPEPACWPHVGYLACSETWYDDREAERAAYATDYYRDVIAADEARMFARDDAFSSAVTEIVEHHDGPRAGLRALAFGGVVEQLGGVILDGAVDVLRLARPLPGVAGPDLVSAWAPDLGKARHLARRLGGLAFVARVDVVVAPPAA